MVVRKDATKDHATAEVSFSVKPLLTAKTTLKRQPTDLPPFTLDDLKRAIGPELFKKPFYKSFFYFFRDIFFVSTVFVLGLFIKQLASHAAFYLANVAHFDTTLLASVAGTPRALLPFAFPADWTESATALFAISPSQAFSDLPVFVYSALLVAGFWAYIFFQGCFMTGLWIVGHECGHRAFSEYILINDAVGWVTHSFLLVPYFSWQISHRRHHSHTGDQALDEAHMTPHIDSLLPSAAREHGADFAPDVEKEEYKGYMKNVTVFLKELHNQLYEFNFFHRVFTMFLYVFMGFWLYLFFNLSGRKYPKSSILPNHFLPSSPIYSPSERILIIMSDIGLIAVLYGLYQAVQAFSLGFVVLMYFFPYLLTNLFFVFFTFLHHTSVALPHYSHENWTFVRGALSTIDRDNGWFYDFAWHKIASTHVCHHLFSSIPFYHAQEATERLKPVLGDYYMSTDEDNRMFGILISMWKGIRDCAFIAEDNHPALTIAHAAIEKMREKSNSLYQESFDLKDPEIVEAVEKAKVTAWEANPHKNGRNVEKEVYWYRTFNY